MKKTIKFTHTFPENPFDTIFCLLEYPGVKFKFKDNFKFSNDEDGEVLTFYQLDFIEGEELTDEEFDCQVSELLLYILSKANKKAFDIIGDFNDKPRSLQVA